MNLYTAALEPADWEWTLLPEGMRLPVTSAARTIVDLAFAGEDRSHVVDALDDARDAGLVDDTRVKQALARRTRRGGRGSAAWLAKQLHA
jgi:hypothetical protein